MFQLWNSLLRSCSHAYSHWPNDLPLCPAFSTALLSLSIESLVHITRSHLTQRCTTTLFLPARSASRPHCCSSGQSSMLRDLVVTWSSLGSPARGGRLPSAWHCSTKSTWSSGLKLSSSRPQKRRRWRRSADSLQRGDTDASKFTLHLEVTPPPPPPH
jgi:hypothetical protein